MVKNSVCEKKDSKKLPPILLLRFSALGDILLTLPVLDKLCKAHSDRRIFVLTRRVYADIFVPFSEVQIISADFENRHKGVFGLWRLAREVRRIVGARAIIIDWHNVLRTKILRRFFYLLAMCERVAVIDKNRALRKAFITSRAHTPTALPRATLRYAQLLQAVGLLEKVNEKTDVDGVNNFDFVQRVRTHNPTLAQEVDKIIQQYSSTPYLIIAPFAQHVTKIYPLDLMEQVLAQLACDYTLVLVGYTQKERTILRTWAEKYGHKKGIYNLSDFNFTLVQEVLFFASAGLALVMDSANMHVAGLARTPTLSLWGATHPRAGFMVWAHNETMAVANLSCRPCAIYGAKNCVRKDEPLACLRRISVAEIVRKIKIKVKEGAKK